MLESIDRRVAGTAVPRGVPVHHVAGFPHWRTSLFRDEQLMTVNVVCPTRLINVDEPHCERKSRMIGHWLLLSSVYSPGVLT
jgi:hypothetical protein